MAERIDWTEQASQVAEAPLRDPRKVMRLARLGAFHQSRLSFMRVLLRRLKNEGWLFDRPVFDIDERGVGVATYRVRGPENSYTLVAFAHELDDSLRSDRVIAEAWDATFTLCDGEVDAAQIERLSANVPKQEAGRVSDAEMVLSRANKSVRLFRHVVESLAAGRQPDEAMMDEVGYLVRTTAVYGSGKFGAADRVNWAGRPEFSGSFQPEMLAVWLIRTFSVDLAEHMARVTAPDTASRLDPRLRRKLGVGNSTGLGMAPFLINHPRLINSWIAARETALARLRAIRTADTAKIAQFRLLARRAAKNANEWQVADERQTAKIERLRDDFTWIIARADALCDTDDMPWDGFYRDAEETLSLEGQEALVSLMMEPYGELVDPLAACMHANEELAHRIDGRATVADTITAVDAQFDWADGIDFEAADAQARVWYVSEEKLEPRLGERFEEPLEPYEQPLSPGRDAARMRRDLTAFDGDASLGAFLLQHPEHRHMARRLQQVARLAYGEICDNTIAAEMLPIDLLRCKLSFFGATRFDPRSDRWLRITMYKGAPFPDELGELDPDDLFYPQLADGAAPQ
ncbi:MAG: hypothetical protein VX108_05865 [Pseudomonadota bacterium]|nr:hypothetical protein [Pseudomonadota bacterium]